MIIYDLLDLNKGEIGASSSHTVQRTFCSFFKKRASLRLKAGC